MSTVLVVGIGMLLGCILLLLLYVLFVIGFRNVLFFVAVMLPLVWMSRLNSYYVVMGDSPFVLLFGVYAIAILMCFLFGDSGTVSLMRQQLRGALLPLGCLVLIFLLSIVFNVRQRTDWLRGFLALCYVILPCFAALVVVRCYPLEERNIRRALFIFLLGGVIIGLLSITSAMMPRVFRPIVTTFRTEVEVGRAFTPLGGATSTGMYLVIVYCLATGQLLAKHRRVLSTVIVAICFVGILTTLTRAAMVAFVIANIYLYGRYLRGMARRLVILLVVGGCLLAPLVYHVNKKYSLERFTQFDVSRSMNLRLLSLQTALRYGGSRLALGGGWGLVYDLQRRRAILPMEEAQGEITLDGMPSAASPHNLYALVFAESGILAITVLLLYFWRLWKAMLPPDPHTNPYAHGIVHGFRGALLGFFVISLFQDTLFLTVRLSYLIYLVIFMGIAASAFFNSQGYHSVLESEIQDDQAYPDLFVADW